MATDDDDDRWGRLFHRQSIVFIVLLERICRFSRLLTMEIKQQFTEIYEREADAIFRYVILRVANREEALDIVQDSFLRFWQTLGRGTLIDSPRSFLFAIARNRVIDWYRSKKSLSLEAMFEAAEGEFFEIADPHSYQEIEIGAEVAVILKGLNELPSQYREVVYLRYAEDLSPKEIAEIVGATPNAISIRLNRGIAELRKILKIENR